MPKAKAKKKPGRYTPPFSADQKKAVIKAYKAGKVLDQLAAQYKCSTSKIRKVLVDGKVTMRDRGPQSKPVKAKKASKPKPKAKKTSKPKAKKTSKPKAKKTSKPKTVNVKISTPKVAVTVVKAKAKKPLTDAQREAKNKADRDRRAKKKSGLAATLAAVADSAASHG